MLASITPLGERGRGSRWAVTIVAFATAATLAGAALGAALGALGGLVSLGYESRLAILAVLLAAASTLDVAGGSIPGPRRQVNERWLDEYRGWVYGAGFGSQLGVGLSTVVTSAATYVAIAAAVLSRNALEGAVVMGSYGAIRGLTPLVAARVQNPAALVGLHRALGRRRATAARAGVLALAASVAAALAGALS